MRYGVSGRGVIVRNGSKHGMQEVDVIISIIIRVPHLHLDFYASLPYGEGEQHWIGHAPDSATKVDVVSVADFIGGFPSVRAPVDAVRSI